MRNPANCFRTLAAAAVLTLGACGDDAEQEVAEANMAAPAGDLAPDAVIIYPAGTEASLEANAMRTEVERLQREGGTAAMAGGAGTQAEGAAGNMAMGNQSGGTAMTGAGNQSGTAGTAGGQTGNQGGSAGSAGAAAGMAGLDRDNDGRLSPAEYAIHALPSETPARQGATNDQKPPYVSDEALNQVVTSFRRLDRNGDFFLSAEEFQPTTR